LFFCAADQAAGLAKESIRPRRGSSRPESTNA
jgi:hypothetical protein